jgi:hypothetical protein
MFDVFGCTGIVLLDMLLVLLTVYSVEEGFLFFEVLGVFKGCGIPPHVTLR